VLDEARHDAIGLAGAREKSLELLAHDLMQNGRFRCARPV